MDFGFFEGCMWVSGGRGRPGKFYGLEESLEGLRGMRHSERSYVGQRDS